MPIQPKTVREGRLCPRPSARAYVAPRTEGGSDSHRLQYDAGPSFKYSAGIHAYSESTSEHGTYHCLYYHSVESVRITTLVDKRLEEAAILLQQDLRAIELDDAASIKDHLYDPSVWRRGKQGRTHDLIRIHDGLQPMSDSENCDIVTQLIAEGRLDNCICFVVDRRRCLIQDE